MLAFSRLATTLALAAASLGTLAGCGGSFTPGRTAGFEVDSPKEIDDEDIRKAFEARPQLPGQVRLAYYTFDPAVAGDLDAAFAKIPGVGSVYRIPPLLVTGERRFDGDRPWQHPAREVTAKKLRLLAARAHADALVIVDHGYKTGGANGFAALSFLILPMLFTPFLDNRVDGYAEAFLLDVRNGYLYGHVEESDKRGPKYATIYGDSALDVAHEQWKTLRVGLERDLGRLLSEEMNRSKERGKDRPGEATAAGVPATGKAHGPGSPAAPDAYRPGSAAPGNALHAERKVAR